MVDLFFLLLFSFKPWNASRIAAVSSKGTNKVSDLGISVEIPRGGVIVQAKVLVPAAITHQVLLLQGPTPVRSFGRNQYPIGGASTGPRHEDSRMHDVMVVIEETRCMKRRENIYQDANANT